jgi:uncharacterized membrane protein YbhN (UPF0104 family)
MNIEFERTIDDVIDFNLFHMAHSSSLKKQVLITQVLIGVLIIPLVFCVLYLMFNLANAFTIIASILAGIAIFALYPQIVRKSTTSRIRKMLSEGSNKAMLGHQVVSLLPEGIFSKNQATESKINWSAVEKVVQSEKHFFLYTSSINALVIPKISFSSEKEKGEFLEYVNTHLQQK